MTTPDDLGYDDDLDNPPPDPQAAEKARNAAAFSQRQQAREAERAELAELREFKAKARRSEALDAAKAELRAEGPLGAFLKVYDGEPTADAIRKAVEADPDFSGLVAFPADPRDLVAAEQAANAAKTAGGGPPGSGQITAKDAHNWTLEKKKQFRAEHPDAWNALMSGTVEAVTAPAGWA